MKCFTVTHKTNLFEIHLVSVKSAPKFFFSQRGLPSLCTVQKKSAPNAQRNWLTRFQAPSSRLHHSWCLNLSSQLLSDSVDELLGAQVELP